MKGAKKERLNQEVLGDFKKEGKGEAAGCLNPNGKERKRKGVPPS